MPTTKKRLNITLPDRLALFIEQIAIRDDVPQATKVVELLEHTLAMVEGEYFSQQAAMRNAKQARFLSHNAFWKKAL